MVHIKKERLDTQRYELLLKNNISEEGFIEELCTTDIIMTILYKIINSLTGLEVLSNYINSLDRDEVCLFCRKELYDLDKRRVYNDCFEKCNTNIDYFNKLAEIFFDERRVIDYYISDKFQVRTTVYAGNYSSFEYLLNFITRIKKLLSFNDFSFYILLDNGDKTKKTIQRCINSLISQRLHKDISFKIAVDKSTEWDKESIQWPHDYSQIDIDELYSTQHTVYYERIKEIASKRLKQFSIDATIEDFLPESLPEKRLLEEIRKELKEKYEKEYDQKYINNGGKDVKSKADYVNNRLSKNAQTELFRRLKKTPKSYAGFNNIVHLSSGIIRQFLDICSYMYADEVKVRGEKPIKFIHLKTQNRIIKRYADDFMDELEKKFTGLEREDGKQEDAKLYRGLYNLIEALGKLYRERLLDENLKEPRVFTFTLKDPHTDPDIDKILHIGVHGIDLSGIYFHRYWYSSKLGYGKYPGYAFNRRLCPRFNIDHISFRGRIELSTESLRYAAKMSEMPKVIFPDGEISFITLDQFTEDE